MIRTRLVSLNKTYKYENYRFNEKAPAMKMLFTVRSKGVAFTKVLKRKKRLGLLSNDIKSHPPWKGNLGLQ